MVFNLTFNNILALLWRSVLLVEKTGGPYHWCIVRNIFTCILISCT
jgi:hypothetical protein